jgi:malonyl CoA-acyl carrier protein transacylase/acyl carrier protein
MGRELYDTFPAAREAMDRLAAKADWDLLGLMDETDAEKLVLTRWQQPYLLLLEYAQFHYLQSLGLRPSVVAGHSLGELIALCFAGAYTPEGAWHILDGRPRVTARREESSQRDTGMMLVHAPQSAIDECLAEFPALIVSNYNTPTQFILSGPKEDLRTASRALRKRRIPAMQLQVSVAFHHPGMRVVREFSLNGLRDVPMQGTRLPMLSNVTTGLYPDDAEGIREYILDLDENPVRWVECVDVMWRQYKARHFLELGPADTLCGLISVNRPEALCIAAGRKGKEAENLRNAVARLHALGHLPGAGVCIRPHGPGMSAPSPAQLDATPLAATPLFPEAAPAHVEALMPLLVEATGFTRQELHPDMDLRYDLSLRSSRFPLIMHEVEKRFGLTLRFDDLLGVATIRDLADRILQLRQAREGVAEGAAPPFAASAQMRLAQGGPQPGPFSLPPESGAPVEEEALNVSRHFSHFRELWLADARPWPDSPHACLPPSVQLAALMEGAAQLFPKPASAGAEELFFSVAECPSGVTREGHVRCRALHAQADRLQCRAELRLRDLLPNGRARRSYSPICAARILLAPDRAQTSVPILPEPACLPESASAAAAGREAARNFYERHTGLGPRFRLLTELYCPEEKRLLARMRVPAETGLVGTENSGYIYPGDAFEAAAQAALALQRNSWQPDACRMVLSQVDAVYFSRNCMPGETLELELRADADEPRAFQCDAELRDLCGQVVLALRGMRLGAA